MIHNKKIIVVMPAYNAEKTLESVYEEIPLDFVDDVILVDDASSDRTVKLSEDLGIRTIIHTKNKGYGANQKTCYKTALSLGAYVVIMLHPDYQYTPKLIVAMASLIANGQYDIMLGSRILSGGALKGGMPLYKYISNRILTLIQNLLTGAKLSEYHTGYRAFSRAVLETLPLEENADDFIFDNQMLLQAIYFDFLIGEISCPARYSTGASSINFNKSVKYGFGVIKETILFLLHNLGILKYRLYSMKGNKLNF